MEVTFRIGSSKAIVRNAIWMARYGAAFVVLDDVLATEIMAGLDDADTIIYRIGPRGDIFRVSIPKEIRTLIDEWLARVTLKTGE